MATRRALSRRRAVRAFTLFEVMIVIAIIVALTGLVGIALVSRKKQASVDLTRSDLNLLQQGLKGFFLDYDRYPTDEEGLAVLWVKDGLSAESDSAKWQKQMEKPLPNDRWGRPWNYRQVSEHGDETQCDIWSNGPDGQDGTDDDVVSWTVESLDAPSDGSSSSSPPTGG